MSGQPQQFKIFKPDQKIFHFPANPTPHIIGTPIVYACEGIEYPEKGGILIHYKGLKLPVKGFPYPEAIAAINVVKRVIVDAITLFTDKAFRPILIFTLVLPKRRIINVLLKALNDYAEFTMRPHLVEIPFMTEIAREVYLFTKQFFAVLRIDEGNRFALLFANLIEYDNAYRFRLEDILSASRKEVLLLNPTQEITRLLAIHEQRELASQIVTKFKRTALFIRLLFFVPSIRKAFKIALGKSTFSNFQYDEIDRAAVLNRGDYNFLGMNLEQRQIEFMKLQDGVIPPQYQLQ